MNEIHGRIGGVTIGRSIKATWDGRELKGRIGGLEGQDIHLSWQGDEVSGRVVGMIARLGVDGEVHPNRAQIRLGGHIQGDDLHLDINAEGVQGYFSGAAWDGKNVQLQVADGYLSGRIGGLLDGKDVHIDTARTMNTNVGALVQTVSVPLALMALTAVCAYKVLEAEEAAENENAAIAEVPSDHL